MRFQSFVEKVERLPGAALARNWTGGCRTLLHALLLQLGFPLLLLLLIGKLLRADLSQPAVGDCTLLVLKLRPVAFQSGAFVGERRAFLVDRSRARDGLAIGVALLEFAQFRETAFIGFSLFDAAPLFGFMNCAGLPTAASEEGSYGQKEKNAVRHRAMKGLLDE
jgi:hypothetical protein